MRCRNQLRIYLVVSLFLTLLESATHKTRPPVLINFTNKLTITFVRISTLVEIVVKSIIHFYVFIKFKESIPN